MDTLTRNIYGRLFRGAHEEITDVVSTSLIGSVFDKTYMPALVLDPGKQIYHKFSLGESESATLTLPENYSSSNKLYIAVQASLKARVEFTSPTHGSSTVLLMATDSTVAGTHAAFWTYQGDMTTFAVSVPSTSDGGDTTSFQVFMYEIPDLEDFESYFDKQIGYGVSGDE